MGNQRSTFVLAGLLLVVLLSPVVHAHEQKTLTVIMTDSGVVSGNITDPSFVQGNAVWFQMHDDTNNTTMTVRLDVNRDGVFNASDDFDSGTLVDECELDENGTLVDDSCKVSATYAFDLNATIGTYMFWVMRTHNGSETGWNHSIVVHKDIHEEDGPSPGDCFGIGCQTDDTTQNNADEVDGSQSSAVVLLALASLVGMIALVLSILKEKNEGAAQNVYPEEE